MTRLLRAGVATIQGVTCQLGLDLQIATCGRQHVTRIRTLCTSRALDLGRVTTGAKLATDAIRCVICIGSGGGPCTAARCISFRARGTIRCHIRGRFISARHSLLSGVSSGAQFHRLCLASNAFCYTHGVGCRIFVSRWPRRTSLPIVF